MNTIPAVGTIFGSGTGSKLLSMGRAKAFVIACLVGIVGSSITMIENWWVFLFAKFIVGAAIGITGVVVARYIEEYVPLAWFGTSQAISLAALQSGFFIATLMGLILPPDEDEEALEDDKSWRLIFALQPMLYILSIILFYIFVGADPPRYYII